MIKGPAGRRSSRLEADYLSPARFDDWISITTQVVTLRPASVILRQDVLRDNTLLFRAIVTLAAIGPGMCPVRLPQALAQGARC